MQRALLLSKPTTRHNTHTRRLQQPHTIEIICVLASFLRCLDSLLRQVDGREEVHGACGRRAADAFHFLESVVEGVGAGVQAGEDCVVFLLVEGVRGRAFAGRVGHDFDHALPDYGRAEHDGDEFVDLLDDLGGDVSGCGLVGLEDKMFRVLTLGSKPIIS
jgi:hypothetical protein